MTITRRQIMVGASATVAAAVMPAVASKSVSAVTHCHIGRSRFDWDAEIGDWYGEIGSKTVWEMTINGWKFLMEWEPS